MNSKIILAPTPILRLVKRVTLCAPSGNVEKRRTMICAPLFLATLLLGIFASSVSAQTLVHRYSFVSDATDSVGGANGTLVGDATVSGGAAVLTGNKPSYVDLPNDLVTNLTSGFTVESWVTWNGGPAWQRIWDFGNSAQGEDVQGQADAAFWLTPFDTSSTLGSYFKQSGQAFSAINRAAPISSSFLHQVVLTGDKASSTVRLYVDGNQVSENTNFNSSLGDLGSTFNNWLGHSQYSADPDFNGSIDEFRIYDGALDANAVAANFANGPGMSGRGNLLGIRLQTAASMALGQSRPVKVAADFENAANLEITTDPQVVYSVSDPAVFSISSNGVLTSIGSIAASADVIATYLGQSSTQTVAVVLPQLLHRYSFDSDASDSVGGANGTLVGDAAISNGAVVLSGNKPSYVDLPNDLMINVTNATIEAWVTWSGGNNWQRIWDFGNSVQGEDVQGQADDSIWLSPSDGTGIIGTYYKPSGQGRVTVATAGQTSANFLHQFAWTYDQPSSTVRVYLDGVEVASNSNFFTSFADLGTTVNNWLGHSQYSADPDFNGSIDEFRIYDNALSASAVAGNFQNGPAMSGRGTLQAIRVLAQTNMVSGHSQQLQVAADFANVANLEITSDAQTIYQVSDPAVLTVTSNGLLSAIGSVEATATVTVSYLGQSNATTIHVTIPTPPPGVLIHRYSFTSDASDLVGGANGTLVGSAIISNNAVAMNGVKPSYVDLPNGMFATLTNYTIETWVTWNGGGNWQRICDFGNNTAGEDVQGTGTNSFFITPKAAAGAGAAFTGTAAWFYTAQGQRTNIVKNPASISTTSPHHIVVTYAKASTTAIMYLDGVPVSTNLNMKVSLADFGTTVNNWLGHSQFSADPDFNGSIDEFRVYDGVLAPSGVAANFSAGPDAIGVPQPTLTISKSGNSITISWSAADTGFTLESSGALGAGANWTTVNQTPVETDGQFQVTITPGVTNSFYRLKK